MHQNDIHPKRLFKSRLHLVYTVNTTFNVVFRQELSFVTSIFYNINCLFKMSTTTTARGFSSLSEEEEEEEESPRWQLLF